MVEVRVGMTLWGVIGSMESAEAGVRLDMWLLSVRK